MSEVGILQAQLTLDISPFMSGIQKAIGDVRKLSSQLGKALGGDYSKGFSALFKQMEELRGEISQLQAEASGLKASLNLKTEANGFKLMQQTTSSLRKDFSQLTTQLNSVTKASGRTAPKIAQVTRNVQQSSGAASQLSSQFASSNAQVNKLRGQTRSLFTDLKQITTGIILSQTFYGAVGALKSLNEEAFKFSQNIQIAENAFKFLTGSVGQAQIFMRELQDHALRSPLDFTGVTEMTRQLMAMNFTAKESLIVMDILTDTAAVYTSEVDGMRDMMKRITLALGQMKAAGKIAGQELRQLYNAGLPVFKILQEELGLTADEVREIGKAGVDAEEGIHAILSGLQKRYQGAAAGFAKTVAGSMLAIKDSFLLITSNIFEAPLKGITKFFNKFSGYMEALAQITRAYGPGGLFQALFPPNMWMTLRNIIGAVLEVGKAFRVLGEIVGPIMSNLGHIILEVLSFILPPLSILLHLIMRLIQIVLYEIPVVSKILRFLFTSLVGYIFVYAAAKAFMYFWAVLKGAKIVLFVIAALKSLWGVMKAIAIFAWANKWVIAIGLVVAALAALILMSERARAALSRFFGAFKNGSKALGGGSGIGFDPNKIFTPKFKPQEGELEDFNVGLGDTNEKLDKTKDKADKAGKAIKKAFNQSFDEVFLIDDKKDDPLGLKGLKDELEDTDWLGSLDDLANKLKKLKFTGDFDTDWGNLKDGLMGGFGDMMDGLDFQDPIKTFWDTLVEAFAAPEWVGAAIGAIIGAIIGGLIGGPKGALIGAAIGGLVGWIVGLFWEDLKKNWGLADLQGVGMGLAGIIGALLGGLLAGPGGAAIGAAIGIVGGGIMSMLIAELARVFGKGEEELNKAGIGQAIGTAIGAVIGALVGGPVGAIIGGAIGNFAGGVVGLFWEEIKEHFTARPDAAIATGIATAVGAAIGGIFGGPIGAALGAGAGLLVETFWLVLGEKFNADSDQIANAQIGTPIGAAIGAVIGGLLGGPAGALIGAGIAAFVGGFLGLFTEGIKEYFNEKIAEKWGIMIGTVIGAAIGTIIGGPAGTLIGGLIGTLLGWISGMIVGGWKDIMAYFRDQAGATFVEELKAVWDWIASSFSWDDNASLGEIAKNIILGILKGFAAPDIAYLSYMKNFLVQPIIDAIKKLFGINSPATTMIPIGGYIVEGILEGIGKWASRAGSYIKELGPSVVESFSSWVDGAKQKIDSWTEKATDSIKQWNEETKESFDEWNTSTIDLIGTWKTETEKVIGDWSQIAKDKLTNWVKDTKSSLGAWKTDTDKVMADWKTTSIKIVGDWSSETKKSLTSWYADSSKQFIGWKDETAKLFMDWRNLTVKDVLDWVKDTTKGFTDWASNSKKSVSGTFKDMQSALSEFVRTSKSSLTTWWSDTVTGFRNWSRDIYDSIKSNLNNAIDKFKEFTRIGQNQTKVQPHSFSFNGPRRNMSRSLLPGHAKGGVFNREHIARFSEGNKKEAIIPLEEKAAMQPFVDAVANGLTTALDRRDSNKETAKTTDGRPVVYVHTLIADDAGLTELERRMRVIRLQETDRGEY